MDFLNYREGGVVFYQVFLPSPLQCKVTHCRNCKRLRECEEIEISRQSCRGDFEKQGGKLLRLLSGFRPRIGPQKPASRKGVWVGGVTSPYFQPDPWINILNTTYNRYFFLHRHSRCVREKREKTRRN
jgi:hypothetical protein